MDEDYAQSLTQGDVSDDGLGRELQQRGKSHPLTQETSSAGLGGQCGLLSSEMPAKYFRECFKEKGPWQELTVGEARGLWGKWHLI